MVILVKKHSSMGHTAKAFLTNVVTTPGEAVEKTCLMLIK